tara:strand:- start:300 stop:554 length:255 start_codon:yes stop_codon:yes gene_type:complete
MKNLNWITKKLLLNEDYSISNFGHSLQAIVDNLKLIRVASKRDANRIQLALEQASKIKKHVNKLNEKISHLEEQLRMLNEEKED